MPDIYLPIDKLKGAQNNDRAIVRIVQWEKNKKPVGEVVQLMKSEDENDKAMKRAFIAEWIFCFFPRRRT